MVGRALLSLAVSTAQRAAATLSYQRAQISRMCRPRLRRQALLLRVVIRGCRQALTHDIYALWPASVLVLRCLFPGWANWLSSWTRWLTAGRPPRPSQRASAWCEVCVVSGFLTRYYSVNSPDPATSDICLARRAGFTREDLALGVCVGFLGHTSAGRIRRQAEGAVCSHACA
jgi:hypothetical protein